MSEGSGEDDRSRGEGRPRDDASNLDDELNSSTDNTTNSIVSDSTALGPRDDPLAVVVEKPRSETAIESLRAEGVYDDDRRVREYGSETVALPVLEPPTETAVLEVVRQIDPAYRTRDLADHLRERGWSDADLEMAPGSWAVIGSVILVRVPDDCPDETELGEALLALHGEADSVLADEGISNEGEGNGGTYREPRTRLLAGSSDTETVHVEDGTRYGLDPARVMFSPGNQAERRRMAEVVDPDERVFDMFAGIGYFTLPMARAGARMTATELNPTAFRYLLENAMANDVSSRVDAYHSDCRDLAADLRADRVVMGYYGVADGKDEAGHGSRVDEAVSFLPAALEALEPGGVVHYHEATPKPELWARPIGRLEAAAERAERTLEVLEKRRVKTHSAGVEHVVVDARVE
ncbi:class I SAM-dependent methyltransferase [Natronosalvus rutilus]|uniref:tRNA(Phe) (4-demethylwyosine(37)-C(7)) aminocarboxypropyltransferase n=1 Tax=Natronosalvus rutilus TaxID=2953753 RepID=A0A9E7N9R5_9EURY|nr:class I SAM-dependent methyltransferase family protein [Natronosalvus rutilus]UTF54332.1 class I SAM-dependent methyltransferase family protein [Natronosalvus rutilus]